MANATAMSEVFWTAFQSLPKKERSTVVEKMLQNKEFIEDLIDTVII